MARIRLSRLAREDIARILTASLERWGREGRTRYARLLEAAIHRIAAAPKGAATQLRPELSRGLRSLHLRLVRLDEPSIRIKTPVHVLYYREVRPGIIEVIRVLHERMEPGRHRGTAPD